MFCYCFDENNNERALFFSLSKAMILTSIICEISLDYCVIEEKTVYEELGLKKNNVTLFKNGTLEHRVEYEF
jgi:hypothetical protein